MSKGHCIIQQDWRFIVLEFIVYNFKSFLEKKCYNVTKELGTALCTGCYLAVQTLVICESRLTDRVWFQIFKLCLQWALLCKTNPMLHDKLWQIAENLRITNVVSSQSRKYIYRSPARKYIYRSPASLPSDARGAEGRCARSSSCPQSAWSAQSTSSNPSPDKLYAQTRRVLLNPNLNHDNIIYFYCDNIYMPYPQLPPRCVHTDNDCRRLDPDSQ